jgi:hypothetical protein
MRYCRNPIIEYTETPTAGDNSKDLFFGED